MTDATDTPQQRLVTAIRASDVVGVQAALKDGADANGDVERFERESGSPDRPAHPVLVLAAERGEVNIVRLLLDAGARIDARGWSSSYSHHTEQVSYDDGPTALDVAIFGDRRDVVGHLLQRGAASERAVGLALAQPGLLRFLLERGLAPTAEALAGALTATSPSDGNLAAMRILLEYGADPNARRWGNMRHVDAAVFWGRREAAELLLAAGATRPTLAEAQASVDKAASTIWIDTVDRALETARALGYDVVDPRSR